jgi:hypothetical protein
MGYRVLGDTIGALVTETGTATSDPNGYGNVLFSESHYSNIFVIVSSLENSSNCFVITKNNLGFSFGTSIPNQKISYKAISVSP